MAQKRVVIMWDLEPTASPLPAGAELAGYHVIVRAANTVANIVWESPVIAGALSTVVPSIEAGMYSVEVREIATDPTIPMKNVVASLDATDAPGPDVGIKTYRALRGLTFSVSDAG